MYSNKDDIYYKKYLKYKVKYLKLKQIGGGECLKDTSIKISELNESNIGTEYRYLGKKQNKGNLIIKLTEIQDDVKTFEIISAKAINDTKKILKLKNTDDVATDILCKKSILPFVEEKLKTLFNINIKLETYEQMFEKFKTNFQTFFKTVLPIPFQYNVNSILYNGKTYTKERTQSNEIKCGTYNCIESYRLYSLDRLDRLDSKLYILRYLNIKNKDQQEQQYLQDYIKNIFDSFYENLKHFILYIINTNLFSSKQIVPKPFGMFPFYKDGKYTFGILMEGGENTLSDDIVSNKVEYLQNPSKLNFLELMCAKIYESLFLLNSNPTIIQFRHNDLKTNNIILLKGEPLLIDFGLSIFIIDGIEFTCSVCDEPIIKEKVGNSTEINIKNTYNNVIYDIAVLIYDIYTKLIQQISPDETKLKILKEHFLNLYYKRNTNIFTKNMFYFFKNLSNSFKDTHYTFGKNFVAYHTGKNTFFPKLSPKYFYKKIKKSKL
jgi:hypothetical protein